jgi:AraC family transcriptional regulator of adaptative response / DNA-3-methyladenine glycosylase II
MLAFLDGRATLGVDAVAGGRYRRTLAIGEDVGWIEVGRSFDDNVELRIAPTLRRHHVDIAARTRQAFDLDADPQTIARALGPLAATHPGTRLPGSFNGFETAIRAILGQQVSVKGASTLAARFAAAFGEQIATPYAELTRLSPAPSRVAELTVDDVAPIGMPGARAATILAVARAVRDGIVVLDGSVPPESTMGALLALPGVGPWTAEYIAMRALGWRDAFPASDLGIRKALGGISARDAEARAEAWRPWRSYAVMHLWRSLGGAPESAPRD